jgi:hypothetical protein
MDKKQAPPERDLNQAGSIVDKSIEYMMGQNITPLASPQVSGRFHPARFMFLRIYLWPAAVT